MSFSAYRLIQLQRQRLTRQGSSNSNSGFTLVELMVVIVIVGILSAIALPNFLKQTDKAKATEAKQSITSTLKQAQAQFVEDGTAPKTTAKDMNELYGTPTDGEARTPGMPSIAPSTTTPPAASTS